MSWASFLDSAPAGDHGVQIYGDPAELAVSVGRYLAAGFSRGEPALLIVEPDHWTLFAAELAGRGCDLDELEADGLLEMLGASATLDAIMDGERPSARQFEEIVGSRLAAIQARVPGKTVRAFGEMVDLLTERGQTAAAVALEDLWNTLLARSRSALLCAYHLDIFDLDTQLSVLPEIVHAHTHPRPAADPARLAEAVDRALTDVVGPARAGSIYLKIAEDVPRTELPRPQAVLMWLSQHDPRTADRVLRRARMCYSAAA